MVQQTSMQKSVSVILKENNDLSIEERILIYHEMKNKTENKHQLEEEMNLYGYNLLWDGKEQEALEIFKLLVSEFPDSANTYDSLAEVYLKTGEKEKALLNYKKAFSLDPDNFNAEDQIEMIEYPNRKKLSPQEKYYKTYTPEQYREDLDQLGLTIVKVHPNALKFISQEELNQLIDNKKGQITNETTFAEFSWMCSEIVASINCSHSNTNWFWQENQMLPIENRFPLQTRLINNKLYVIDPLSNTEKVSVKDEIVSINGVDIEHLISTIFSHISSQGLINTSKRHEFNMWSTGMIAYGLGLPDVYSIKMKGKPDAILLDPTPKHNDPNRTRSQEYCGGDLCFKFLDTGKKIGSLTISSFNYYEWNNLTVFQKFIDNAISELRNNKSDHLVVDLRGNGGGSPESSIHLLKYLISEPFHYSSKVEYPGKLEKSSGEYVQTPFKYGYRGKLYFLIDGKGNSTTGHFMSIVKDRKLGTIIGEELGSNQFCSADRKRCRLSQTKLQYNLAINTHISSATQFPDEVGILPDHYVTQSIEDYIARYDAVYQYVIELIEKDISWTPASKYHSSYFLNADPSLSKEIFQIPLDFAPDMTLKGIEDARFLKDWRNKEGDNFWSYSFGWNINHSRLLTTDEMSRNLEFYFNGLMRIKERGKDAGISESIATLSLDTSSKGPHSYSGQLKTLDGFFKRKPMTFNIKAEQQFCEEIQRTVVIFRFSPQDFESEVWNRLEEIQLPSDICNE